MSCISFAGAWKPFKRRTLREHRDPGAEVICVIGGVATWQVEGEHVRVPAGSLIVTWPWERHGSVTPMEPGLELIFAAIRMQRPYRREPKDLRWHADLMLDSVDGRKLTRQLRRQIQDRRTARYSEAILWLLQQVVQEYNTPGHGSRLLTASLSGSLLVHLNRCLEQREPEQADPLQADARVQQVLRRVEQRCQQPWSLQSMAAACGLGRSRFADLVRQQTGDTPMMYLNRLRVHQALQLLQTTDRSITDIAMSSGFRSSQYFCRVFKAYTGMTAGQARQSQLNLSKELHTNR